MPKVSIIMPVYNAEKYLDEAIASVLKQTYPDFELILINDRSTDRSKEICLEYREKDNRIVFFENNSEFHGPGPTRNIGLDHANGEYLYFMDADDWIEERLLECAVHRMRETNADIVQFGAIYERDGDNHILQYCWSGKDILTKDEIKENIIHFLKEHRSSLWLHFFRRETVKEIQFENLVVGEDICFIADSLCCAARIAYIKEPLYHYRYVEGSTSHRWNEATMVCRERIWVHQRNFLDAFQGEIGSQAYAEVAYDNYIWGIYLLCERTCPLSNREKKKALSALNESIAFESYRGTYPLSGQHGIAKAKYALVKYRLEGLLLLFGPLFLKIVRGE